LYAAFGQAMRMAKLGVKEIFYYKDMKVTFTNGKVSNVEQAGGPPFRSFANSILRVPHPSRVLRRVGSDPQASRMGV
jgi:hypothetical protein